MKRIQFYLIVALAVIQLSANAQKLEVKAKDTFEKTIALNGADTLTLITHEFPIKTHTWNKNEVKIVGKIKIEADKQKRLNEYLEVFKNPKITKDLKSVSINLIISDNFYEKHKNKKIDIPKHHYPFVGWSYSYEVWIPKNIYLNFKYPERHFTTIDTNKTIIKIRPLK